MALFYSIGAALNSDGTGTEPVDWRKTLEGLVSGPGVLPGASSPLVEGVEGTPMRYQVNAATWATPGASGGVHLWGNDGPIFVPTDAAPGTGQRIDIIYALHTSNGEGGATASAPVVDVQKGAVGSPAVAPAIPAGAIELARNTMTSSATDTAGSGNSISQTAATAWLIGGEQSSGTVTAQSGFSSTGVVRKQYGQSLLTGALTLTAPSLNVAGSFVQVGTVQAGFRPTETLLIGIMTSSGAAVQGQINTSGQVFVRSNAGTVTLTAGQSIPLAQFGPYVVA